MGGVPPPYGRCQNPLLKWGNKSSVKKPVSLPWISSRTIPALHSTTRPSGSRIHFLFTGKQEHPLLIGTLGTVGIFGPYVLAVWVGNFNGVGNPAFVGLQAAAPLFFDVVDAVKSEDKDLMPHHWVQYPNVKQIHVCSVSGKIPNDHCPHQVKNMVYSRAFSHHEMRYS